MKNMIVITLICGVAALTGAAPQYRHKQLTTTTRSNLTLRLRPRPRLFMCASSTDIRSAQQS